MMNKFFNKKTEADGILFDSAREAARYKILKEMQKKGEITALELQFCLYDEKRPKSDRRCQRLFDKRLQDKEKVTVVEACRFR